MPSGDDTDLLRNFLHYFVSDKQPAFMVNACFVPTRNEILFPSAILQPPFFAGPTPEMPFGDVACNFGGIGAVIAHEITRTSTPCSVSDYSLVLARFQTREALT